MSDSQGFRLNLGGEASAHHGEIAPLLDQIKSLVLGRLGSSDESGVAAPERSGWATGVPHLQENAFP